MLVAHGMKCAVTGDLIADTLALYGNAVAKVDLWVDGQRANEAVEILDELHTVDRSVDHWGSGSQSDWRCRQCDEVSGQGFDECWSCSTDRSADARLVPAEEIVLPAEAEVRQDESPYRVPPSDNAVAIDENSDELTARAFRAAIFGVYYPFPIALYAAYLSLRCWTSGTKNWRFWVSVVLTLPVMLFGAAMLLSAVQSGYNFLLFPSGL